MIDRFKSFLSGSPYKLGHDEIEGWAYILVSSFPSVMRKWYDSDFRSVEQKDGAYYSAARRKLSAYGPFQQHCSDAGETLRVLKLLIAYFEDETRKAGLGKTTKKAPPSSPLPHPQPPPAQPPIMVLEEGAIKEMHVSRRERNSGLRKLCIEHYRSLNGGKVVCAACGLVFGELYGEIGDGYIEVHHLYPISQMDEVHSVDPKTDLVPLCANCHAMIHRLMSAEKETTGIDLEGAAALGKLKAIIQERRSKC